MHTCSTLAQSLPNNGEDDSWTIDGRRARISSQSYWNPQLAHRRQFGIDGETRRPNRPTSSTLKVFPLFFLLGGGHTARSGGDTKNNGKASWAVGWTPESFGGLKFATISEAAIRLYVSKENEKDHNLDVDHRHARKSPCIGRKELSSHLDIGAIRSAFRIHCKPCLR